MESPDLDLSHSSVIYQLFETVSVWSVTAELRLNLEFLIRDKRQCQNWRAICFHLSDVSRKGNL